jgi:hypothetical protein
VEGILHGLQQRVVVGGVLSSTECGPFLVMTIVATWSPPGLALQQSRLRKFANDRRARE